MLITQRKKAFIDIRWIYIYLYNPIDKNQDREKRKLFNPVKYSQIVQINRFLGIYLLFLRCLT